MVHPQTTPDDVPAILAAARGKIDRLRAIEPCVINRSMRETPVGARMGQTLDDKLRILPNLRGAGFRDTHPDALDQEFGEPADHEADHRALTRDGGWWPSNLMMSVVRRAWVQWTPFDDCPCGGLVQVP